MTRFSARGAYLLFLLVFQYLGTGRLFLFCKTVEWANKVNFDFFLKDKKILKKKDLFSLDPSCRLERSARQSPQILKMRLFVWRMSEFTWT